MFRRFHFTLVSFTFNTIHGFQNASCPNINQYNISPKFWQWIRVVCFPFSTPVPIDIIILHEISVPEKRVPIAISLNFNITLSLLYWVFQLWWMAFSWLRIFRNSFLAVTYSTFLEFILWILRIKTATSALMLNAMFNTYFLHFWIEVVPFNSLLTTSASAKVTCSDDFPK